MTEHLTQQADVIAELDRILESEFFASTGKISRLLRFVVTETLAGRAHQIKESIIGVEVYQRRQDYDPKTDAIVRVEAGRLRARLDQYYASLSQTPALRIQLPKGTYVPVFVGTQPVEQPAEPKPASAKQQRPLRSRIAGIALGVCIACIVGVALLRPLASRELPFSITVLPTRALGTERSLESSAPGFSEQVAAKLSSRSGILVATHPSGAPQSDALLETAIQKIGSQLIVTAKLIRRSDGSHLWSQTYTSESTDFARFQDLAAELLTRTLWMNFAGVPDPFSRVRQRKSASRTLGRQPSAPGTSRTSRSDSSSDIHS